MSTLQTILEEVRQLRSQVYPWAPHYYRKEAAQMLKISPRTLDAAIEARTISFTRIGGRVAFLLTDLENYRTRNRKVCPFDQEAKR